MEQPHEMRVIIGHRGTAVKLKAPIGKQLSVQELYSNIQMCFRYQNSKRAINTIHVVFVFLFKMTKSEKEDALKMANDLLVVLFTDSHAKKVQSHCCRELLYISGEFVYIFCCFCTSSLQLASYLMLPVLPSTDGHYLSSEGFCLSAG